MCALGEGFSLLMPEICVSMGTAFEFIELQLTDDSGFTFR